jgi:hypothetical protein
MSTFSGENEMLAWIQNIFYFIVGIPSGAWRAALKAARNHGVG